MNHNELLFPQFLTELNALLSESRPDDLIIAQGKSMLGKLLSNQDWLPDAYTKPKPRGYAQYLLHCDPLERFSVVSFVWGPSQSTPVHNHTVWGIVGVLKGAELCEEFACTGGSVIGPVNAHLMTAGETDFVSPSSGDWHRVSNASDDVSISIHVYGGNIGTIRRNRVNEHGQLIEFVSGYDNAV